MQAAATAAAAAAAAVSAVVVVELLIVIVIVITAVRQRLRAVGRLREQPDALAAVLQQRFAVLTDPPRRGAPPAPLCRRRFEFLRRRR